MRRRAAVPDRAGEVDRRLQGMHQVRGLLRRLWVLKLRARGSTSVDGRNGTHSGRGGMDVAEETREYWGVRHWLF